MFRTQGSFVNVGDIYRHLDCASKFELFIKLSPQLIECLEQNLAEKPLFKKTASFHTAATGSLDTLVDVWAHPSLVIAFLCYCSPEYFADVCSWIAKAPDIFSLSLEDLIRYKGSVMFETFIEKDA
jgi:hypothetical protein